MFSWRTPPPGILVVAHRGASGAAPENTLAAFSRALADGARAFELDARLTADGRVVVFHDRTLSRTGGSAGRVSDASSADLRRLSAGAWFSPRFAGERIPFLEEALELAGGETGVNVELKFDSRRADPGPLVRRALAVIRGAGRAENVLVSSFHHGALALLRRLDAGIAIGVLVHPPGIPTTSGVRIAERLGAGWLIYSGGNIRKAFVARAAARGIRAMEYTVNTPARVRRALRYGVDGVITNEPGAVRALV